MKELCAFVARALNVDVAEITEESGPLTLAAWDSFNHVHLMVAVEEAYRVEIPIEDVVSILTVRDLAELLVKKGVRIE